MNMLRKFSVSNFKGFQNEFILDLTQVNGYEFNTQCIKSNIVNNAIIYGNNGVGKSNLAFAIFDIIEHITDKNKKTDKYTNYLNAYTRDDSASFGYELLINDSIVTYEYRKQDHKTLTFEQFKIDNEVFVSFDRQKESKATVLFRGAETLKAEIDNPELSVLKYIKSNTQLDNNKDNHTFIKFMEFVDNMLFFRSLETREYLGSQTGVANILEEIIKKHKVKDFEDFLNEANVECRLREVEKLDKKTIAFEFNEKVLQFEDVVSTGTSALTLFYYWFLHIQQTKVPFVFIDEFDAFYHPELSELIVKKLKEIGIQFILTTHNTSIMTNELLRPDCYFSMSKNAIYPFSKIVKKELREAHNIEKMYKAGAFHVE